MVGITQEKQLIRFIPIVVKAKSQNYQNLKLIPIILRLFENINIKHHSIMNSRKTN